MTSPSGEATNGVYGFISMVNKALGDISPTHVAVVWDGGLAGFRTEINPGYKAQRPAMPDSLENQISQLQTFLPKLGVVSLCRPNVEADDWIASICTRMAGDGGEVVIASADKDFMQLVSSRVRLLNSKSDALWGVNEVVSKAGVRPDQIVDWLSLMGDVVDNIEGVPGVGSKTAADLLVSFDSIDGIYSRIAEVKPERIRNALIQAENLVRRNQKLVRLKTDYEFPDKLEELLVAEPDLESVAKFYHRWGFRRLLADIESRRQSELAFAKV